MTDATATRQPTRAPSAWRRHPPHDHRHVRASAEEPTWQQRYEQVLQANERLHEKLQAQEEAHRKSLTVVKYEPSLPNNDVFTKQLLDENRQLIARYRALELKLARIENGQAASSPRRSVDKSRVVPTRKKGSTRTGFPLKHASVQTDDVARDNNDNEDDTTVKKNQQREAETTTEAIEDEEATQSKAPLVDVQFLVTELKQRLTDLDVDLVRLREENELLRMEMLQAQQNGCGTPNTQRMEDLHAQLRTKEQQQELEHLLSDRIRQMKILEEQFTHLQHKVKSKSLLYKESLDKIEQLHAELFDAKQTMLKQAEWLHAQEDRNLQLTMLEKEVHVLRSENAKLNDTVGMLSARPLDALNVQLEKKALEISLLDDENTRLENELKKASQDHRIVMQTNDKLRGRVDTLTKQIDAQLVEVYELKRVSEQTAADREIAELQLQFYLSGDSAESKQLMEAVGRALKSMQREESDAHDDAKGGDRTEKCETCSHKRQEPTSSLYQERIAKMNDISRLIQDDTRAQLQDMRVAHQAEVHALRRQSKRWEQRANEYLKEIASLQKDQTGTKSLSSLHGTTKKAKATLDSPRVAHGTSLPGDSAIETLMSARVFDLRFTPHSHSQDESPVSDFVVFCDYFDFEPQHSPVFGQPRDGAVATVDLEISYKLHVDRAFCLAPLAAAFNVELHELRVGSAAVVGVASASFQSLFMATDGNSTLLVKILDPITRVAIGSVRIALSLTTSTSHLFKTWRHLDHSARLQADLTPSFLTRGLVDGPQAVLSVRVIGMVLTKDMAQSSATEIKLRYRFMGHPTVRYSVKKASKQTYHGLSFIPVDHAKQFAIPTDPHFLEFLSRHEMALQVKSDASGVDGNAVVAFRRHSGQDWSDLVSAVITKGDPGTERSVGRIWLELQFDGLTKETKQLDPRTVRPAIERVFGCQDGYRRVAWRRFCGAISLSSTKRAVRGMLVDKLSSLGRGRPSLRLASAEDTLSSMLERCGVRMSRTELCFISGVLLPSALDFEEDQTASSPTYWQSVNSRLELIEATMDSEWLQIENALQHHIAAMDVVVDHGGDTDEYIDWETFAYRTRLAAFNRT